MRIASISKPISSVICAKLVELGKLDLDKSINEYANDLPLFRCNGNSVVITARHLNSHTSGIRHYDKNVDLTAPKNNSKKSGDVVYEEFYIKQHYDTIGDSLKLFINDKLLFEPGISFAIVVFVVSYL